MRLDWLPDVLADEGLPIVVEQGWLTRGGDLDGLDVIIWHHDAVRGADLPSLKALITGRSDLAGPLCQLGFADSGKVHVIAAGKANHAGKGRWRTTTSSARTIGFECSNDGVGEPWWPKQLESMHRATAAICRHRDLPADVLCGHKEWALPKGRKIDPFGIDMTVARRTVGEMMAGVPPLVGAPTGGLLLWH